MTSVGSTSRMATASAAWCASRMDRGTMTMPRRNRLRFLVASTALLAVLPACVPPAPVTPPSPTPPAQPKLAGIKLFTGGLGLPAIAGSKQATSGSAGAGAKGASSTSVTTAGTTPTTPATTSGSGGGGASGGGNSSDAVVSLEGFLDQPTYVADSGDAVQVATEAELRAARNVSTSLRRSSLGLIARLRAPGAGPLPPPSPWRAPAAPRLG